MTTDCQKFINFKIPPKKKPSKTLQKLFCRYLELIETFTSSFLHLGLSYVRPVITCSGNFAKIDILTLDMIDLKYIDVNHHHINEAMSASFFSIKTCIKIFSTYYRHWRQYIAVEYYFRMFNLFIQGETSGWWVVVVKDFLRFSKRWTNSLNTPLNCSTNLIKSKCDCFVKNQFRLYKVGF